MACIIQVLLPLVCVVLAEVQIHLPFFHHVSGLPQSARPTSDVPRHNWPTRQNLGGYHTWFQHFGNPDQYSFNSDRHEIHNSYQDPFYHGDPYYQGNGWYQVPGINNMFKIPNPGYNAHRHQHMGNNHQEKPKQDNNDISNVQKPEEEPTEIPQIDKKLTEKVNLSKNKLKEDKIDVKNKLNESNISEVKNNSNVLLPKLNEIKKENKKAEKELKLGMDTSKGKDFLLVGQGNNGNNVYLLHENIPYPSTVITPYADQPGNNTTYVPYNPGQTNNPVYQVINGQPASLPTNIQTILDKVGVSSGYNKAVKNPGQATMNVNAGNQNPAYVTMYSNGQLIQIPGVVVKSAPNDIPLHNGNQGQGTNYIIADTVPNNMQNEPATYNPGTNVMYATTPNQASNVQIYGQKPNCDTTMSNSCGSSIIQGVNNGLSSNGLPSNVVFYQANPNTAGQSAVLPNYVSNGYVQPNIANQGQEGITVAIPNQSVVFSNQNSPYKLAVEMPVNPNGYNQPLVLNLRQGQNAPNQGDLTNNHNMPLQTAVQLPVGNGNGFNEPIVSNQVQGQNIPNQGAIQIPIPNGYN